MARRRERFYIDTSADSDIIAWLERQENKSRAIRHVIRQAIQRESISKTMRQVIREELANTAIVSTHMLPGDSEPSHAANGDVDVEAGRRLDEMF